MAKYLVNYASMFNNGNILNLNIKYTVNQGVQMFLCTDQQLSQFVQLPVLNRAIASPWPEQT